MSTSQEQIRIEVHFYSFFKDLTGCASFIQPLPAGSTLTDLQREISVRFPRLGPMRNSMLTAVGVEYQDRTYRLRDGEEVSLFPPVQGG
jgi:molybdopterin converting factor small subunit